VQLQFEYKIVETLTTPIESFQKLQISLSKHMCPKRGRNREKKLEDYVAMAK